MPDKKDVLFRYEIHDGPSRIVSGERVSAVRAALLAPGAGVLRDGGLGSVSVPWEQELISSREWACAVCGAPASEDHDHRWRDVAYGELLPEESVGPRIALVSTTRLVCGAPACAEQLAAAVEGTPFHAAVPLSGDPVATERDTAVLRIVFKNESGELKRRVSSKVIDAEKGLFDSAQLRDGGWRFPSSEARERATRVILGLTAEWMDALIRPQPLPCLVCNQLRTFVTVDELRRVSMLDPRVKALVLDIWPSCSDAHCLRSLMKLMNKDARDRLEADPKSMTPRCYQCGFSPEGGQASMKRCSRCKIACYCSVECQRAAWPSHKKMCRPKE